MAVVVKGSEEAAEELVMIVIEVVEVERMEVAEQNEAVATMMVVVE